MKKRKLTVIFCVAVLAMPIFGVGTAKASPAPIEWTRNSTFVKSLTVSEGQKENGKVKLRVL